MFATGETVGLAKWIIDDTYLSVVLHDFEHLHRSVGCTVGEERDEQGHVVHGFKVGTDILDTSWQLSTVGHVVHEWVGVTVDTGMTTMESILERKLGKHVKI